MRPFVLLLALPVLACSSERGGTVTPLPVDFALTLEVVTSGVSRPLYLTAPAGDGRLFIVSQAGQVRIVQNDQLLPSPFLDISAKITSGGERGLLSLAFHPRYATNGFFYVNYTDRSGDTVVERYQVSSDANRADPASAKQILFVKQPFANHNGGHLLFGVDGMLYVGMGDGGSGGDPQGNGQNKATLLGKLLRLDVDRGDPYAVPSDNPFVGQAGARGELWATGLRNPWRFWFDRTDKLLYIGDVGQNATEEVDVMPVATAGVNYGWNRMEGEECYGSSSCDRAGLTLPALTYPHVGGACSITGGIVYRGQKIPEIRGHYFYADYCAGWVKSFQYANGRASEPLTWDVASGGSVVSFGEDGAGEMYLISGSGAVYRFARKT